MEDQEQEQGQEQGQGKKDAGLAKIAKEAIALGETKAGTDEDSIKAAIFQQLRKNTSEEVEDAFLWDKARRLMWAWQDEQRRKKSGKDELASCTPECL